MVQKTLPLRYPLRIAIPIVSSHAWLGGFNYLLNLARALASHASHKITPVVFFGENSADIAAFAGWPGIEVVVDRAFSKDGRILRVMQALLFGVDKAALKIFAAQKIDIVFEPAKFFGRCLHQPAIAWFPDLQHRRMPHMFGHLAWLRREIGFRLQLRHRRTILVSSEDAQSDCLKYYAESHRKTRVLRFPALIEARDLPSDPRSVLSQYKIPDQFIFLPNQFWHHKNHALVIEALGILRRRSVEICVVATGSFRDPRNPVLHHKLMSRLHELGATCMFRALGIVPRSHVIALLQTCSALINPSICEGWSSGVEEAKMFNVPLLLSDIAVHREQAGVGATYFDVNDPMRLANILAATIQSIVDQPRSLAVDTADAAQSFAEAFAEIAIETYKGGQR